MKREILFKAKRIDTGEWVEGFLHIDERNKCEIISHWYKPSRDKRSWILLKDRVDPETVCQYTGLKDKNGVKIFEGDVITSEHWNPSEYKVIFNDGEFVFVSILEVESPYTNSIHYAAQFELTGSNIHD